MLKTPSLDKIKITDIFISRYRDMIPEKVLPYQWEVLNDHVEKAEKSWCVSNFRVAAKGLGERRGEIFQDSDLYKWLECVAYSLQTKPDKSLEALAEEAIGLIEAAQCEDGYINTYYTLNAPEKRWTNLQEGHELYCAGHLFEAAAAYYEATGNDRLLKTACRFADYIDTVFGTEEGKKRGYPGHQEIELALVKLFRATGNRKYINLAKYFIDERGAKPNYFDSELDNPLFECVYPNFPYMSDPADRKYSQSHMPPAQQTEAVGHAVRAVYMYSAMADLAGEFGDTELLTACKRIFDSIANKKMYITGGIGSAEHGERFTSPYDLPGDYGYMETCASIGLMMFSQRMFKVEPDAKYIDVLERALYNRALAGISLSGTEFLYVSPVSLNPGFVKANPNLAHIKPTRQKWFNVACCPTNIARTLAGIGHYIYAYDENTVYLNLYIANEASFGLKDGTAHIAVDTQYPFGGRVSVKLDGNLTAALRIPQNCTLNSVSLNGTPLENPEIQNGYLYISGNFSASSVEFNFGMPALKIRANPRVSSCSGKAALMKGPIVYCIEETDNGENLSALATGDCEITASPAPERLPKETDSLRILGTREEIGNELYSPKPPKTSRAEILAVPYCLWGNRGEGEMQVYIREK